MAEPPSYEDDPTTPTHRYRPSLATNASGLAESTLTFGSLMSSDGFARLSQFPPPPQEIPFTPSEGSLDIPSPVVSDYSQTSMPMSSTVRRPLPIPPVPPIAPLNVQKRPPGTVTLPPAYVPPSELSPSTPPNPPASSTYFTPPLTHTPSTVSSYPHPSPHDWHDGSSSIANDPYGEAALPTSFITSLLSSMTDSDGSPGFPPSSFQFKRGKYDPSVISNALTTDSTITYPPPRMFPPPLPSPRAFPPMPSQSTQSSSIDSDSPEPLTPPAIPVAGRSTPETLRSFDSGDTARQAGSIISHMIGGVPGAMRGITTPSLQSLNSSTPLMPMAMQGEPIPEEDEPKTATPSGYSTPGKSRSSRGRRASIAQSSKSARSYVSSMVARISHSSTDRRSIKQVASTWFRGKPLPPVPPLPYMPFRDVRKAEDALALPDLVSRAQVLSAMLDNGQRPYDSDLLVQETKNRQGVPTDVDYRIGPVADVWNSGANPNIGHGARGRKSRSGDFYQRPDSADNSPVRLRRFAWSNLSKRQRVGCVTTFMIVIVAVTVAIAVGVIANERKNHVHVCPGTFAGAACDLGKLCSQCSLGLGPDF